MQFFYRSHRTKVAPAIFLIGTLLGVALGGESKEGRVEENREGKLCVARLPKLNSLDLYLGSKPRPNSKSVFQIVLDEHDTASVNSDSGAMFAKVDTTRKHNIKISLGGSPRENFKFTFKAKGSTSLCLFYRKAYGTWSLEPLAWNKGKCSCGE
jgi:hypothetical protein